MGIGKEHFTAVRAISITPADDFIYRHPQSSGYGVTVVRVFSYRGHDYFCLNDIFLTGVSHPGRYVDEWLRHTYALKFLEDWEWCNNPNYDYDFDGGNGTLSSLSLEEYPTVKQWAKDSEAIGIVFGDCQNTMVYVNPKIADEFVHFVYEQEDERKMK